MGEPPREPLSAGIGGFAQLSRVLATARVGAATLAFGLIFTLAEIACILFFPLVAKRLIDGLGSSSGLDDGQIVLLLALMLGGAAAAGAASLVLVTASSKVASHLRGNLVAALVGKQTAYFDRNPGSDLASRVVRDAAALSGLLTTDLQNFVSGLLLLGGSLYILATLDGPLCALIFAIVCGTFLFLAPLAAGLAGLAAGANDRSAALSGMLTAIFGEMRTVKSHNAEAFELARSREATKGLESYAIRSSRIKSLIEPAIALGLSASLLAILFYGSTRVSEGTLSVGTLAAFILYVFNISSPLIQIAAFLMRLQESKGASARIYTILFDGKDEDAAAPDQPIVRRRATGSNGSLRFENLSFGYAGTESAVIDVHALSIPQYSTTVFLGPSGSGKTTLLSLLCRFYAPGRGSIFWNGVDIAQIPIGEWRRQIALVPQNPVLLGPTIFDNLCYGLDREVSKRELGEALEAANCLEFIDAMPAGLATEVGVGGFLLSGGQRQRIAIARALLRRPRILLLDEPSSGLDVESEMAVLRALDASREGRTTLLNTHRWAALDMADHIVVMDAGKVAEFGTRADVAGGSPYLRRAGWRT